MCNINTVSSFMSWLASDKLLSLFIGKRKKHKTLKPTSGANVKTKCSMSNGVWVLHAPKILEYYG